jgi:hypothetical protein
MSEEMNNSNDNTKLTLGRGIAAFTLGAVMGASLDALIQTDSDGTLVNTALEASSAGLGFFIGAKLAKKTTSYALNSAGLGALGSAFGQTIYHYLKNYY